MSKTEAPYGRNQSPKAFFACAQMHSAVFALKKCRKSTRRCTCGKQDQMRCSGLAKCIRQHLVFQSIRFAPLRHEKQTKTTQRIDWCFTTNIYPTCISRAFQMHFSSPEECVWHWFPIMFSLGFCWLMTCSILLMCFLCIKAVGIEKRV